MPESELHELKRYGYRPGQRIPCHCGPDSDCEEDCDHSKNYGLAGGRLKNTGRG